jgi:DNA invertase Pin-like site-specific DNA recombinase
MEAQMGKLFGYARVSTDDQDLTVQREALKAAGVSSRLIFKETASGTKREGRDELNRMLELAHEGDTIVITRIDRLARSMKDLQDIVHELKEKGVLLKATEQPIDTSNSMGKMFFDMLGVFAEFETNIRRERQAEGIAKAKSKGAYKGRKRSVDRERGSTMKRKLIIPAFAVRKSHRSLSRVMSRPVWYGGVSVFHAFARRCSVASSRRGAARVAGCMRDERNEV